MKVTVERTVEAIMRGREMGVYDITVMRVFFERSISVILILICGIAASCRPAVCGFSYFWLTVFGNWRSFTVLRHRSLSSFALSCLIQVKDKHSKCGKWLHNFWQLIYDVISVASICRAFRSLYWSLKVFSYFLAMAEVVQDVGEVIKLDGCSIK